jgi:fatty-acyl-CoA synthase
VADTGATSFVISQELYSRVNPLLESGVLQHVVVAAYSDYLEEPTTLSVPDFVAV